MKLPLSLVVVSKKYFYLFFETEKFVGSDGSSEARLRTQLTEMFDTQSMKTNIAQLCMKKRKG